MNKCNVKQIFQTAHFVLFGLSINQIIRHKNDRPHPRAVVFDALVLLCKVVVNYFALVGKVNVLFSVAAEL